MGRHGYLSDVDARRMGLDRLKPISLATLPPNNDRIRTARRSINPQHLAEILDRMLDSGGDRIEIGREMALQFKAICDAIVRLQQSPPEQKP